MTLTNDQKATLLVFQICCYPDVAQKVDKRFAKMLSLIKIDGLQNNLSDSRFSMNSELYNCCVDWGKDSIVRHHKDIIMDSFGN